MSTPGSFLSEEDFAALDAEIADAGQRLTPSNGRAVENPFLDEPEADAPQGVVVRTRPLLSGEALRVPEYVIEDLVERGTYSMLYGPWGTGKTQIALDWALRVALGLPICGRATRQGPVVIVAGEGQRGLERRALAWAKLTGHDITGAQVLVTEHPVPLGLADNVEALVAAIDAHAAEHWGGQGPVLIVSDTLATNSGQGDENDNAAMSQRLAVLKTLLYLPYDAALLELHHPGKDTARGPRGASALQGDADLVLELAQDTNDTALLEVSCTKAKDVQRPEPVLYRSHAVPLMYPDGVERASVAVEEAGAGTVQRTADEEEKGPTGRLREFLLAAYVLQGVQEDRLIAQQRDPATAWLSISQLNTAARSRDSLRKANANYLNKLRTAALEKGYLVASPAGDVRLGKVHL